jgi:hypothetical protein
MINRVDRNNMDARVWALKPDPYPQTFIPKVGRLLFFGRSPDLPVTPPFP